MTGLADKWRTQPMYTFGEAARLAKVSPSTVKNWFRGYTARDANEIPPLFPDGAAQDSMISFLQLIETVVAARLRKLDNVRYRSVHSAYLYAREYMKVEFPFAHLSLEALGGHIIARREDENTGESLQALDSPAQWSLPGLILETIRQIEYEGDLAAKWFPQGKEYPIVVDPRVSSGIPTVAGRGVTVQTIRKRWKAGHKINFIAQDLDLETDVVETVLQYGDRIAA
ncbi:MAG: DUF433 domain-containing protein [Chloroflexi bacterium]|nr:DUF433 domain-containing protein [Chloroflexota bacterium]